MGLQDKHTTEEIKGFFLPKDLQATQNIAMPAVAQFLHFYDYIV